MVVELHVGQHRDLHREREHRAVGLVGLHHQPLARAPVRVGQTATDGGTHQPAGLHAGGAQDVHEHRGGGRLAVRARHRDRAPQRAQLAQQLRAGPLAQPPLARRRPLGVLGRHGAGVDDLHALAGGQVGGVVADARLQHAIGAQALQIRANPRGRSR